MRDFSNIHKIIGSNFIVIDVLKKRYCSNLFLNVKDITLNDYL